MTAPGKLSVFFGMAAGVGKTYAMLKAAKDALSENIDVVIGYLETHQRQETEKMATGIPQIPRRTLHYRDKTFEEMDTEAILKRHPTLVLVDELAHSNIPGSTYTKRWQDVHAFLEAGIDVYTTINVQHIESRSDDVAAITGIEIQETVPDVILENAHSIQLVDLSPEELLKRLEEGKVYLPEKAHAASLHFFKPEILMALRELALRFTAEKVDSERHQLTRYYQKNTIWNTNERLMVAVSPSPYSKSLIRTARRLAFNLNAPWIAIYINQGIPLTTNEQDRLLQNLALAQELGAEILTTTAPDLIPALAQIAQENHITKIVVGRTVNQWWHTFKKPLTQQLTEQLHQIDIYVVKHTQKRTTKSFPAITRYINADWKSYAKVFVSISGIAILSGLLTPMIGYQSVGFLFIGGVLLTGTFTKVGPILFSAILSSMFWNFFFIPPIGTFTITHPEDAAMCLTFLAVAIIMGITAHRMALREWLLHKKEEQTRILTKITESITYAKNMADCLSQIKTHSTILHGTFWLATKSETLQWHFESDKNPLSEKEMAVLEWVHAQKKSAGWSTKNLSSSPYLYLPLVAGEQSHSVLIYQSQNQQPLLLDEQFILMSIVQHLSLYLHKQFLEQQNNHLKQQEESEKLYGIILNSISHELRTPITALSGNLELLSQNTTKTQKPLIKELQEAVYRLDRIIGNLLSFSKINAGHLHLNKEWIELKELITHSIPNHKTAAIVQLNIPENYPLLYGDPILLGQVFENLFINAIQHTPANSTINLYAHSKEESMYITIEDQGTGIPPQYREHVFQKFFRLPNTKAGGIGLGLAITKEIIALHKGTIRIDENPNGGTRVEITLPPQKLPDIVKRQ